MCMLLNVSHFRVLLHSGLPSKIYLRITSQIGLCIGILPEVLILYSSRRRRRRINAIFIKEEVKKM